MRLATFNVEDLGPSDRPDESLEARLPRLRALLEELDADILCLQEINAAHGAGGAPRVAQGLARLIEGTRYAGFVSSLSVRKDTQAPADRHNLAILTRWPIRRSEQLCNDLVPPLTYRYVTAGSSPPVAIGWDRPALHVEIESPDGATLHVINAHLRAPLAAPVPGLKRNADSWRSAEGFAEGLYLASLKRAGQALELRRLIDRLFDAEPAARIVVAGDFNAEPHEIPLRILRCDPAETGDESLAGRSLRLLAPPEDEAAFTVLHEDRRLWVDHILVSQALSERFQSLAIMNMDLTGSPTDETGRSVASHHAPLVAMFDR